MSKRLTAGGSPVWSTPIYFYLLEGDKVTFNIAHLISQGKSLEDVTQNIFSPCIRLTSTNCRISCGFCWHWLFWGLTCLWTALYFPCTIYNLWQVLELERVEWSWSSLFVCQEIVLVLPLQFGCSSLKAHTFSGISFSWQISSRKADTQKIYL